jgi:PAS domain S-box-containing protein
MPLSPSPHGAGPLLPTNRTITLLLTVDGRLRHLIAAGPQDRDLPIAAGTPIQELAPFSSEAPHTPSDWVGVLDALRAMPTRTIAFDLTVPGPTPDGAIAQRRVAAIPVTDADAALEAVVVRFGIASEQGGLPDPDEERFRFLAETVPHMLWMARMDGTVEYYSPSWLAFTGMTLDELKADGYFGAIHPDDLGLMDAGEYVEQDFQLRPFRMRRYDGEYRWMEIHSNPVRDAEGQVLRIVGSTTDITERVVAEQHRRALADQLEAAVAVSRLGRVATNHRDDTVELDERAMDILGISRAPRSRAELKELFPPIHPDDRAALERAYNDLQTGASPELDVEFRVGRPTPDGGTEERWLSFRVRRQYEDGEVVGSVGVVGDVTHRHVENAAMLRAQKREALGTLAGGIAHDFNNVISAILSNAMVAETEIASGVSPAESLSEIRRGAERAADVVRRLLGFSRDGTRRHESFDVADVAREACALLQPTLPPEVTLHPPSGAAPPIVGSSSELHQVLVNLIANAGDAAGGRGGHVHMEVDAIDRATATATLASDDPLAQLPPGRYVRFRVIDDGPGIPADALSRIFDPFFTTKGPGRGTGLGLTAALAIVRSHGGEISASNRARHQGAVFTVLIPAAGDEPAAPDKPVAFAAPVAFAEPTASTTPASAPAEPHVLFVDDDENIARLAERALPLHGCRVTVFTDSRVAMETLRADPGAFDAVITDLAMPGLTGLDVATQVRATRPELPVILSSGYLTLENRARAAATGVLEIIPKPCSIEELASTVHRVAGARDVRE